MFLITYRCEAITNGDPESLEVRHGHDFGVSIEEWFTEITSISSHGTAWNPPRVETYYVMNVVKVSDEFYQANKDDLMGL